MLFESALSYVIDIFNETVNKIKESFLFYRAEIHLFAFKLGTVSL